jgi:hypothetical protein
MTLLLPWAFCVACSSSENAHNGGNSPEAGTGGTASGGATGGSGGKAGSGGKGSGGANVGSGGAPSGGSGGLDAGSGLDGGGGLEDGGVEGGGPLDAGPPLRFVDLQPESAIAFDGNVIPYVVTMNHAAPAGGATITIEVLPSGGSMSLTVPATVFIPAGESTAQFDATLHGVGAVALRLSYGTFRRHAWIATPAIVNSLVLAEVFFDPYGPDDGNQMVELYNGGSTAIDLTNYTIQAAGQAYSVVATLASSIAPGACIPITGLSGIPDTKSSGPANAVALFDGSNLVDAVIYGGPNTSNLPDETGTPGSVDSPSGAFPGLALYRVGPNAWWDAPPSLGDCSLLMPFPPDGGPGTGGADAGRRDGGP